MSPASDYLLVGSTGLASVGATGLAVTANAETPCDGCCGGEEGCTCPGNPDITLPPCCCLDPGDPDYCGDDDALCADICDEEVDPVPDGCACGGNVDVGLPDCCCIHPSSPLSCAADPDLCITPCESGATGCDGCDCCDDDCGYNFGSWTSTLTYVGKTFYGGGGHKSDESLTCTCVGSAPGPSCGCTGTCTITGYHKKWSSGGTLTAHWNGSYSFSGCCIYSAGMEATFDPGWIVGSGTFNFAATSCAVVTGDDCAMNISSTGVSTSGPGDTCSASFQCHRPLCATGEGMRAAIGPMQRWLSRASIRDAGGN